MNRVLAICILGLCTALIAGCPRSAVSHGGSVRDQLQPATPIPLDSKLVKYDKLKLGMSEFDLAQAYNAPQGKGNGFTRVLQGYDQVSIHTVTFDVKPGEPTRLLLLEFYRDQLCRIVDRRDGMTEVQAQAWLAQCTAQYGAPADEPVAGAQWSWGGKDSVLLSFTQDNSSPASMSGNVVLAHEPTLAAAQSFLATWEEQHAAAEADSAKATE